MGDCKTLFVVFCCFIVLVILTPSSQHGFNHFPQEAPALYETRCISEPYKFPRFAADHTRKTDEPCSEDFANSKATDLIDNLTVWRNCRSPNTELLWIWSCQLSLHFAPAEKCATPKIGFGCVCARFAHKVWTCDRRLTLTVQLIAQAYSRSAPGAENNEDMHFAALPRLNLQTGALVSHTEGQWTYEKRRRDDMVNKLQLHFSDTDVQQRPKLEMGVDRRGRN